MSAANQLKPYKGSLDIPAITKGMNAAIENAKCLARDARLLLENGRWPVAASIATLSIEESGKVSILRRFIGATEQDLKSLWKEYRSHTSKNVHWILPELVAQGARRLEDFRPIYDATSDHPDVLDAIKQIGFYSDCLGSTNWSVPTEVVDQPLAASLVRAAELLSQKRRVTERELELWKEHVSPIINGPMEWSKQGVIKWHEAMQSEGLAEAGKISMQAFINGSESEEEEPGESS